MDLLASLNPRQKEAVTHPGGPLLVVAGAGSGKTRVLAHRIAYLLSVMNAYPSEILAVTFTNKAAGEMGERVRGLVGSAAQGMWMGTFHSVCARILRVEGKILGISSDFSIYDDRDQTILMKQIMGDLGISLTKLPPPAALSKISWAKSNLLSAEEVASMAGNPYEERIATLYSAYEKALRENNALDFDDLILLPVRLFKSSPEALERNARRFRQVLIDEYQDTNRAQYALVRLLSSIHRNVCAVGDDDQSIYRWRGADITNLLNFEQDFPDATVIRLEQSYRSTKTILAASQAVIKCNVQRKDKELWTENAVGRKILVAALSSEWEEGEFLARSIEQALRDDDRHYSDFAILYRTNAQSRAIEDGLRRSGLPYVIVTGNLITENYYSGVILSYSAMAVMENNIVEKTVQGHGLACYSASPHIFGGNKFRNNSQCGMYLSNSSPVIDSCWVGFNGDCGIKAAYYSEPVMSKTSLVSNRIGLGAYVYAHPVLGDSTLGIGGDNDIRLNDFYAVYNTTPNEILAHNTWWGEVPPDPAKFVGQVDFSGWLTISPAGIGDNDYGAGLVTSVYPNPFFSTVRLSLSVADRQLPVSVDVYDITGRLIRRIAALDAAGEFRAEWDGRDSMGNRVASGTYFFAVTSRSGIQTRKVVLVR
ncbi:UvrD-helicase domain-containing protein [Candidatus Eisenbacteria bacterium]|uniref:DNA 3'-5' helicase n=1 Tax=Eiseniibacteriota bacterium TaxID=2212470 RepID=A0ABV6YPS1_UNCEI